MWDLKKTANAGLCVANPHISPITFTIEGIRRAEQKIILNLELHKKRTATLIERKTVNSVLEAFHLFVSNRCKHYRLQRGTLETRGHDEDYAWENWRNARPGRVQAPQISVRFRSVLLDGVDVCSKTPQSVSSPRWGRRATSGGITDIF